MASTHSSLLATPKRLLVVDDEAYVRIAIIRALMLQGHTVSGAASGEAALEMLTNESFDLMVLDMKMPGMDGIEVMRYAQELQSDLLIVVLTGYATLESALVAVKVHAADYLLKPASVYDIADAINRALAGKSQRAKESLQTQITDDLLNTIPQMHSNNSHSNGDDPQRVGRFVHYKSLMLDREHRLICLNGNAQTTVALTEGEFSVLDVLFSRPGQTLNCRQVMKLGLGTETTEAGAKSVIRPYISRLRKKLLALDLGRQLIITVRGRGYALHLDD